MGDPADVRPEPPSPVGQDGGATFSTFPELWGQRLCLDLVNSRWTDPLGSGETFDRLLMPGWRAAFLARWDLTLENPAEPTPVEALSELRRLTRVLIEKWAGGAHLGDDEARVIGPILGLAPIKRELKAVPRGYAVEVKPFVRNWNWVMAEVVVSLVALTSDGRPDRLKVCGNPSCSWLFYDESRNRSRRWCSARACGNLIKVRSFRARRTGRS